MIKNQHGNLTLVWSTVDETVAGRAEVPGQATLDLGDQPQQAVIPAVSKSLHFEYDTKIGEAFITSKGGDTVELPWDASMLDQLIRALQGLQRSIK